MLQDDLVNFRSRESTRRQNKIGFIINDYPSTPIRLASSVSCRLLFYSNILVSKCEELGISNEANDMYSDTYFGERDEYAPNFMRLKDLDDDYDSAQKHGIEDEFVSRKKFKIDNDTGMSLIFV